MGASMDTYRDTVRRRDREEARREQRRRRAGRMAARRIARRLRQDYDVSTVRLFGSLVGTEPLGPRTDIDLAVEGLPADQYFEAVAMVQGMADAFSVDLIREEQAPQSLRDEIKQEGVTL
jgi:predicted nucleotidyltransferase